MEKKPEVDGKWKEFDAKDCIPEIDAIRESEICVITALRIEIGGEEKSQFSSKLDAFVKKYESETENMTDEQRSCFILRKMIVE